MIKNNRKNQFPVPQSLTDARAKQEHIALTGNKGLIKDDIYKGKKRIGRKTIFEVREAMKVIYFNKCAYCEIKEHKPEVEHFRPKKSVTGVNEHPGYYWLCYEWSNLLPSCRYCNTEGGKGNRFPVLGVHCTQPPIIDQKLNLEKCGAKNPPLKDERPYLLNPETDDPKMYFEFKNNGEMMGVDQDGRGKMTIKICNLNRQNLLFRRQQILDNLLTKINDTFTMYYFMNKSVEILYFSLKQILQNLESESIESEEFSLMKHICFANFDSIVLGLIENKAKRDLLMVAYNEINSQN